MLKVAGTGAERVVFKVKDNFKPTRTLHYVDAAIVGPKTFDEAERESMIVEHMVVVFVRRLRGSPLEKLGSKCDLQVIGLDDVSGWHFDY